jgi:hypothetical protein
MTRGTRRTFHLILLTVFTILIIGCQARTGWLLLATNVLSFALLRLVFLPVNGRTDRTMMALVGSGVLLTLACGLVYFAVKLGSLEAEVVAGNSVSDLSRLAYQVTALKIFDASPAVGVGLGQFAFRARSYMPTWGFFSPEIVASLYIPGAPWPNTYSLYARTAAELGLVGVVGWVTIWVGLIFSVHRSARAYTGFGRTLPAIAYPIIMTGVTILVTGATTDTFRTPMMWIALGAGACFSARSKQQLFDLSGADLVHTPFTRVIQQRRPDTCLPSQSIPLSSKAQVGRPSSGHEKTFQ